MTLEDRERGKPERKSAGVLTAAILPGASGYGLGCLSTLLVGILAFSA